MKYFFLLCSFLLISCSGLNIEEVPLEQPRIPPDSAQPSPMNFNKIRFSVPTGTPTLSQSPKGPFGLLFCDAPYGMIHQGISSRSFPKETYRQIFADTLEGQGYDVADDPGMMFDEDEEMMRSTYSVGARIIDIKMDVCQKTNYWFIDRGKTGEAEITIEWTVFDKINWKTVYKATHKGYARHRMPNYEAIPLLQEMAFQASVHNFGADPDLYDLMFKGIEPKNAPKIAIDPDDDYVGIFDPLEEVTLPAQALYKDSAAGRLEKLQLGTVRIQTQGHGSGFFITQEGHIITNAHVVGFANRARIMLSGKKKALPAEVLRIDRRRDIALLKLENIDDLPSGYEITTYPVRLDKPKVGEEVYAIGAPAKKQLQDTVTKGIISAHRYSRKRRLPFIQADPFIFGGNSGGPLLDVNGNIIAVAVEGWVHGEQRLHGLNNFIPIKEAFKALDIDVNPAD